MFTEEAPTFTGRYYRIEEALNVPRPIRPTGIPILVGGSGERRTLRLVAKYADACNLFGDLPTIRHKLEVLQGHCEAIGRDPAQIIKTRLGAVAIAPTEAAAEKKSEVAAARRGWTLEQYRAYSLVGTPDTVSEQARAYLDAGLDGLFFNMPDVYDLESVALAGKTLSSVVSA
jgi:alkanesulfonate monooxygenase SsuD/methylene tetrahydromethanopterin reductase-like flavin-dependent oxidoreductase (luciferase family)